jgi:5S rRNA maturation endonuclease (ribonuclease M5)
MEFFRKYFSNSQWIEFDTGEIGVLCPFPHKDEKGNQYYESVPSAHISETKSTFHCKVCGKGLSEAGFVAQIQGVSYRDALVLLKEMEEKGSNTWDQFRENFTNSEGPKTLWKSLGLTEETAELLQVGYNGEGIDFPVFIYGDLLDVRNYVPGRKPAKVMSQRKAKNLLVPFDIWRQDDRPTLLCAGEKDMAIARQMGFNALTFTGGEQAFPKLFKASFKGKKFFICYDNDQAGHEGARKIASMLKDCGAIPYVVTGHYSVCTGKGEDIHDFFIKYGRTGNDLQRLIDGTVEFTEEDYRTEQAKYIPNVSITDAMDGKYSNRLVSSRVQVVATYEEGWIVPEYAEIEKTRESGNDTMKAGETATYTLDENNIKDILLLMDSNLKESQVKDNIKMLCGIPIRESNTRLKVKSRIKIHKAVVADDMESETVTDDDQSQSMRELLVYSVNQALEPGKKYRMFYKPVPHPLKGMQIVGVVTKLEESDISMNNFHLNDRVLDSLKCFQVGPNESVAIKMDELYERSKGIIGAFARREAVWATELFYNTPLEFYFGGRLERAYIDAMIIGPERSGKSESAKHMMRTYELGLIASLKTTTVAGLMGGSDQTAGGWKTKLGLLPRNHKGAIILEEFSGGGQEIVSKLTEARSSGRVRITRVNGSIDVPAKVRMLSISNVAKDSNGTTIPIRNYPHGIKIIQDLVGTSEDIARYDFFLVLDEPKEYISPLTKIEKEAFDKSAYQNRVRWIWSRKPEQIVISPEVEQFIVDEAMDLNHKYNSSIKLFGPEAWKKLVRIAMACAAMVCSLSADGQCLIVKQEHVEWAKGFMVSLYDNGIFKLVPYVENQRRQEEADEAAISRLQGMYDTNPIIFKQLEMCTEIGVRDLQMISGMEQKEFMRVIASLVGCDFISFGTKVIPTQRFRMAMNQIDRYTYLPKLGER